MRHISDVDDAFSHPKIYKFLDIEEKNRNGKLMNEVDKSLQEMMDTLHEQVTENLPFDQIHCYDVPWENGITRDSHREYLEQFADDFYTSTKSLIDNGVSDRSKYSSDPCYVEVLQHLIACVNHVRHFQGRQNIIQTISDYITGDSNKPFVVHGASGSGKTSVLAKAASIARDLLPEDQQKSAIIVVRFLGTSPATSSIMQTIKFLCQQLASFGNENDKDMCRSVEDFRCLVDLFYNLLERYGAFRRIVLFLDSLDQLDSSSGSYHLTWLRTTLPHNVKIIVSTLPKMFDLLSTLKAKLPEEDCYVEVRPLEKSLCHSILKSLLNERKRDLTEEQWRTVCAAFEECSLPIFVLLIFHQVLLWKSYQVSQMSIAKTVRGAIRQLFEDLERKHGKIFTQHALAYITASRNGLSEVELEDLLSLDDEVLRDVFEFHLPPLIRIPPLCWTRLRQDIGNYLVEREADNTRVVYWYHRQFIEVAREYFLEDEIFKKKIYSNLADYFLGVWGGGKEKPFRYPKYLVQKLKLPEIVHADRIVPSQPYIFEEENDNSSELRFNLRKLNELPHHLICAGRLEEFYDYIALDFDFLFNKLRGTSRYLLLRDLSLPEEMELKSIPDVRLVYNAIRLAAQSLLHDPANIVVDLVGRLMDYENDHYRIHMLLNQCRTIGSEYCSLIPLTQCFESGSGLISTSFDLGISFGVVTNSGLIMCISMISNDLTWHDFEGNFVKTIESDYNVFMVLKFLMRMFPLIKSEYTLCIHSPKVQSTQQRIKELEKMKEEYDKEVEKKATMNENDEIDEKEVSEKSEESEESEESDEEAEEGVRGIDVVKLNLDTGMVQKLWTFTPEIREEVQYDNIEHVGDKYIIAMDGEKSNATIVVVDIEKREIVEKFPKTNRALINLSQDEVLFNWLTVDITYRIINFKNMTTGRVRRLTFEGSQFKPLNISYMGDEILILGVGDERFFQIRIFNTATISSADDDDEIECIFKYDIPEESTKNWPQVRNALNKSAQAWVSGDRTVTFYTISNGSSSLPGFTWNKVSRKLSTFNHELIEQKVVRSITSNWGSSGLMAFTTDNKYAFTTASKVLFLVWSIDTGELIRIVQFGEAEGMLAGISDDKLVICHFPDESACDDADERMFIMAKIYNISELVKSENSTNSEDNIALPICNQNDDRCTTLLLKSNILVHTSESDCTVYDFSQNKCVLKEKHENKEDIRDEFNVFRNDIVYENSTAQTFVKKNSFGETTVGNGENDCISQFFSYDSSRSRDNDKTDGFFDTKRNIAVSFTSRSTFSISKMLAVDNDCEDILKSVFNIPLEEVDLAGEHDDVYVDKRTVNDLTPQQVIHRPSHPETFVAVFSEDAEHHKVARTDNVTYWGGFVVICDFSEINLRSCETNLEALKFTQSKPFDVGTHLVLLEDGIHAINYRLHIYNIETGDKLREIQSEFTGTYTNILVTPDFRYVIGQYLEPACKIEFAIFDEDSSMDSDEMYMRVPSRTIQIYNVADGKRIANYWFEMDPYKLFFANEGKALVMMFHNEQLRLFELRTEFKRPRTSKSRGGRRRALKTAKTHTNRQKQNGPKSGYLKDLDLNSILVDAFKVLVEERPNDPISMLSDLLREQSEKLAGNGTETMHMNGHV